MSLSVSHLTRWAAKAIIAGAIIAAPALAGAVGTVMAGGGAYGAYNAFEKVFA